MHGAQHRFVSNRLANVLYLEIFGRFFQCLSHRISATRALSVFGRGFRCSRVVRIRHHWMLYRQRRSRLIVHREWLAERYDAAMISGPGDGRPADVGRLLVHGPMQGPKTPPPANRKLWCVQLSVRRPQPIDKSQQQPG